MTGVEAVHTQSYTVYTQNGNVCTKIFDIIIIVSWSKEHDNVYIIIQKTTTEVKFECHNTHHRYYYKAWLG